MPATSHTSPVAGKSNSTARWRGGPSAPRSGQASQSAGGGSTVSSPSPEGRSRCWLGVVGRPLHGAGQRPSMRSSLSVPMRRLRERVENGLPCSRVRLKGRKDQGFCLLPLNVYLPVYGWRAIQFLCDLCYQLEVVPRLCDSGQGRALVLGRITYDQSLALQLL